MTSEARPIVIVGGGFGGAGLVRALQRRLPPGHKLWLISEESYTTFSPMLPEAVGASIFPEHVVAPLRELVRVDQGHRFIMARVTGVDFATQRLDCQTLAGPLSVPYEHLVLAIGNRARLDLLPGMAGHARVLKTVGDAMDIRNTVLRRLAEAELRPDAQASLAHFVVVGGGFSGVEVAGELVDCLHSIAHYYPGVAREQLRVSIVHDGPRLLPELPEALGAAAQASLQARGVQVCLGAKAQSISAEGLRLLDAAGRALELQSATVVCTIGTRPNALLASLGQPMERGRLCTRPDMRLAEQERVWALGDCAAVPNGAAGTPCPPTAQFATRQATVLAANLLATLRGATTQAFAHEAVGMMAAIGHMKGVAQVGPLRLSGLPAWLLWRAYYLLQMPTFGRKLRIFVEWTWGMFFPADITHLRFTLSRVLDAPPAPRDSSDPGP